MKFPWHRTIDWQQLRCRHGCEHPVVGIYYFPEGCWCFDDPVQVLCAQHAIKGRQNNPGMVEVIKRGR